MRKPEEIVKEKLLLVEGNDQRNFFFAFLKHIGLEEYVQVMNFGGVNELKDYLPPLVKMPGFRNVKSVGLVRDAENSEAGALQSVQSALQKVGLPVPPEVGAIAEGGHPLVGILILPGDGQPGMLETLINDTFSGTAIDKCIDVFFDCVEKSAAGSIRNEHKARAFAFLATTENARHSVGVAAKRGDLNLQHGTFARLRDFLNRL